MPSHTAVASPLPREYLDVDQSGGNSEPRSLGRWESGSQASSAGNERQEKVQVDTKVRAQVLTQPSKVSGCGRAQQLLEFAGCSWPQSGHAERLVEDGGSSRWPPSTGGAGHSLIVRGLVGLCLVLDLAHADLVHAHRQVGGSSS